MKETLLKILVCPEDKTSLRPADVELLRKLNSAIEAGNLKNRSGTAVAEALEEGLVREDGRILYPVRDGIPVMLIEESIELSED